MRHFSLLVKGVYGFDRTVGFFSYQLDLTSLGTSSEIHQNKSRCELFHDFLFNLASSYLYSATTRDDTCQCLSSLCWCPWLWELLCIHHRSTGRTDNNTGCTPAQLGMKGNSGDIQTGVGGPSIKLTGWRSCQEYECMLWSMLLCGRMFLLRPCCCGSCHAPPERLALTELLS